MTQGTFDYQNRVGSRMISYLVLVLTVCLTLLVRNRIDNSLLVIFVFLVLLILLSLAGVYVNRALFVHEATYELTPTQLQIHAGDKIITLTPEEVNGVGCDPIYEKRSKGTDTVNCWHLTLMTVQRRYEFYSVNVLEQDENNRISIHEFKTFAKELKHWVGML